MGAPQWSTLRVLLNDRAAIYAEHFPASLVELGLEMVERFTHEQAQEMLFTFAGAWPVLGRDTGDPATRFIYVLLGDTVCRFRAVELAPGAIIVDDVTDL